MQMKYQFKSSYVYLCISAPALCLSCMKASEINISHIYVSLSRTFYMQVSLKPAFKLP